MIATTERKLVLASTSSYRATLLHQLGLDFEQVDPETDESENPGETPEALAQRLARRKAEAGALIYDAHWPCLVIGADQVAHLGESIFHKPGQYELAARQLKQSNGQWVSFCTAICLIDEMGQVVAEGIENYEVRYRHLSDAAIRKYLQTEQPYDCAGSIKVEGRGISLIAETRGRDINTLYGLPLILLVDLLDSLGFDVINNIR